VGKICTKSQKSYFLKLAIVVALLSNIATADGIGNGLQAYLDDGWNYGAVDDYINWDTVSKGRLDTIIYGITHYPPDYVFDIARTFESAFGKVPQEAMRRAQSEKQAKSTSAKVVQPTKSKSKGNGPLETLGGAAGGVGEFAHGSFRFVWHYAAVSLEGMAEQLTKRPSETAAHGFWAWFWVHQCSVHGSSNGNGAGGAGGGGPWGGFD